MNSLKKMLVTVLTLAILIIPANSVFAATTPVAVNPQQVALAQQIINQQIALFQASGVVLTPEQLTLIQQNANNIAAQQIAAVQAQLQQAAALQAQQLQAQQMAALQAQQQQPSVPQTMTGGSYVVNGKNGKIHIVGGCTTPPTVQPIYVNSYQEATAVSSKVAPGLANRNCGNCYR